jgi:heme oxygenase
MAATSESRLQRQLRDATHAGHVEVNQHPLLALLLSPDLTRLQYGNALCALHGMMAATERSILDFLAHQPALFDYALRSKRAALETDLAALGRTPLASAVRWPVIHCTGDLIGLLYTLEGSTLGGEFIARRLRELDANDFPTNFHDIYGGHARERWNEFLALANAACPVSQYSSAATAAASLFAALKSHLDALQPRLPDMTWNRAGNRVCPCRRLL